MKSHATVVPHHLHIIPQPFRYAGVYLFASFTCAGSLKPVVADNMAPERNAKERAAAMQARGAELELKADLVQVVHILRTRADVLNIVKQKLTSLGFLRADGTLDEDKLMAGMPQTAKVDKQSNAGDNKDYSGVQLYTPWLLSQAEPIALGRAAQTARIRRVARSPPRPSSTRFASLFPMRPTA